MTIEQRTVGSVAVLDLSGAFKIGEEDRFRDKVNSLVFQGQRSVLVNMAQVSYIDSTCLGALVAAYTTVTRGGGRIGLVNLTSRVSDVMAITKLLTVFDVYDSESLAVVELSAERSKSASA
jgi:anti-sigma B factor antagonist